MAPGHKAKIELNAQIRTIMGGKVESLRRSGLIPAVLYGKNQEPISLQVPQKDFSRTLRAAGESTLVYVDVSGKTYPTIIHDVARDPLSDEVIHADFLKVNLSEAIKTKVPVVFVGESPAVKEGGILIRNVNELEVEALPQDLPHEISIDISSLEKFGDQVLLKEINLGEKVQLHGNPDEIIAVVQEPISEEALKASLEAGTETVEDVQVVEQEKPAEEPVEGTEAPAPASAPTEEK